MKRMGCQVLKMRTEQNFNFSNEKVKRKERYGNERGFDVENKKNKIKKEGQEVCLNRVRDEENKKGQVGKAHMEEICEKKRNRSKVIQRIGNMKSYTGMWKRM